ncbi:MAG: J domain-containing protein [Clostridium sp.]|nr:J domain-containing protein [Clostridium sp.]
MGLFKRIKNIVRSNINSKNFEASSFENFSPEFGAQEFNEEIEETSAVNQPSNSLEKEYYANLELPFGAGFDEIKSSYKRLLKKYHPDKFYGNEKKLIIAQDVVKKLNMAYNYFEEKYNK